MEKIFQEIQEERKRQNEKYGGSEGDDMNTAFDWSIYIREHAERAINRVSNAQHSFLAGDAHYSLVKTTGDPKAHLTNYRKQMIRVAALAVAAIESYDRKQIGGE